jgi:hypothetical protein
LTNISHFKNGLTFYSLVTPYLRQAASVGKYTCLKVQIGGAVFELPEKDIKHLSIYLIEVGMLSGVYCDKLCSGKEETAETHAIELESSDKVSPIFSSN